MDKTTQGAGPFAPAPDNVKIDEKVIKKMIGEEVANIPGILDVKDGLADLFKADEDRTRGISVELTHDHQVSATVRIITEMGVNIPELVEKTSKAITNRLQDSAGLVVQAVCVEVADTMTRKQYDERNLEPPYAGPGVPQ